ncbi:MAG: DUF3795 domain-containing protein [Oscillospiraceae bacterium]|nr:DUF3795 domain-containing protein [Oscillospiraceae bacterium]
MERAICGADCGACSLRADCRGCARSGGKPFGVPCFIEQYIRVGGREAYERFKQELIRELNGLQIPGMPPVQELHEMVGSFVNLKYPLAGGGAVRFLDDCGLYLAAQLECEFGGERCFGVVACMEFLLVCTYGAGGSDPELVLYKKR